LVLRLISIVAIAYGLITLLAWVFQHHLLYLPHVAGREWAMTPEAAGLAYENLTLVTEDDIGLSAWWIPARPQRGVLLFFHGNAGNISHRMESIDIFHRLGMSVLIVDYRGYGASSGKPSESGTYRDAKAAWHYLTDERGVAPDDIVVFGRSLGAAVGAHLARGVAPAPGALILESPMTSAPDMAQSAYPFLPARWLTRFRYATDAYVRTVNCPVLVVHSRDDEIIPFSQGKAVFSGAPTPKRFLELKGGHNTGFLESGPTYVHGIDGFLTEMAGMPPVATGSRGAHRNGAWPG